METTMLKELKLNHGIQPEQLYYQLTPEELQKKILSLNMGEETTQGALAVRTGVFTGRSPKDRYIVKDKITEHSVDWGAVNLGFEEKYFDLLYNEITSYLNDTVYLRDCFACADPKYKVGIRVINEFPWSNMFVYNMFIRPRAEELEDFKPEWTVINAPGFKADPERHHTSNENFTIISFTKKIILIGGTGYTGEIKKGVFSALNFTLPLENEILTMHCAANVGKNEDTAIFFGLSGTGKTTLSTDCTRRLIGDDEHGWSADGVFNFEGGCYAKVINLSSEQEPEIFNAVKKGALLENIVMSLDGRVDYTDGSITQNTRVSYPIHFLDRIQTPSIGSNPKNIFLLTADAFGVLPPISKLTEDQAVYYFISGYTAKIPGTENGIVEPMPSFSACFGAPFLPLNPVHYAKLLMKKLKDTNANVWLVNTGWTGGSYGTGHRISLKHTRRIIKAVLDNASDLENKNNFSLDPIFNLSFPKRCGSVPESILNPILNWENKVNYQSTAEKLAQAFINNFRTYEHQFDKSVSESGPLSTNDNNY